VRLRLYFLLLCLLPAIPCAAISSPASIEASYGQAAGQTIETSMDRLLSRRASATEPVGAIAQRCLAADSAAPLYAARAKATVADSANVLVAMLERKAGEAGWTFENEDKSALACAGPGTMDAFHDGSCNPAGTNYMYQTSLALTCLAKAAALTGDRNYATAADSVVRASWPHGGVPPGCGGCWYYWYSYHANDAGHFVRNTNALMGMALAAVYRLEPGERLRQRIQGIANSEHHEIASGNEGYLGMSDPQFLAKPQHERARIENHLPLVAISLFEIGRTMDDMSAIEDAKSVMSTWLDCPGGGCAAKPCDKWAGDPVRCTVTSAAAPCILRKLDSKFADACETFLGHAEHLNAYQLWMVFEGLK
jgi:hypothetical protein